MYTERGFSPEVLQDTKKAAVVLFPDIRTTGDPAFYKDEGYVPLLAAKFRETTTNVLDMYKMFGFKTYAFVYGDTNDGKFSYLYPEDRFDKIITWDYGFGEWGENENFKEVYRSYFPKLKDKLNLQRDAEVVVGGYHAQDCVYSFASYLKGEGYRARSELLLTDELPFLLISHEIRRSLPSGMRREHVQEDSLFWQGIKARKAV